MKAGKLSESVLKRSVLKQLHMKTDTQAVKPGVGNDFGAVNLVSGENLVTAVATRLLCTDSTQAFSVYAALNNLACSGAEPLGVTINLLIPPVMNEQQLRNLVQAVDEICLKEQVPVMAGHTESVRSVTEPILTVTALGTTDTDILTNARICPGMDILVTKWIALEGTVVLAREYETELKKRFAQPFLDRAKSFAKYLSIRSEAAVAAQSGAVALHDLSESGIYGALWEMGQCSGVGLEIDLKKIPVRQETVEICEYFDLNPYKLLSAGSLLIAAEDGSAVAAKLAKAGIPAAVIGKATDSNDRVLINGEERRFLETAQTDELWKMGGCYERKNLNLYREKQPG